MRSPIFSNRITVAGATATWGAAGSLILPVDYIQLAFGVVAGGILSEDAAAITYSFFVTYDGMSNDFASPMSLAQTTTTITVTDPNLPLRGGVTVGDVVQLLGTGGNTDGWYVVASTPSTTSYTVTSLVSQTITGLASQHKLFRLFAAPAAITGASTRIAAAISITNVGPCTGLVLKATAITTGSVCGVVVQGEGPG